MLQAFPDDKILVRTDSDPVEHYVDVFKINTGLDLKMAIRFASREYLLTEEGMEYLRSTGGAFNYGDAIDQLPEEITMKHGFKHAYHLDWKTISVDQNEDLVPDDVRVEFEAMGVD